MISSKTRTATVQFLFSNNRHNQKHFKGKTIWRTRFRVPPTTLFAQKTILLYKLFNRKHPCYLFQLISSRSSSYVTRTINNIPFFSTRHGFLKNSFFPSTIIECNKFDHNIRNSIFRKTIVKFIRPSANNFFHCHNPKININSNIVFKFL